MHRLPPLLAVQLSQGVVSGVRTFHQKAEFVHIFQRQPDGQRFC